MQFEVGEGVLQRLHGGLGRAGHLRIERRDLPANLRFDNAHDFLGRFVGDGLREAVALGLERVEGGIDRPGPAHRRIVGFHPRLRGRIASVGHRPLPRDVRRVHLVLGELWHR